MNDSIDDVARIFTPDCMRGDARYDKAYREAYAELAGRGYAVFPDVVWNEEDARRYGGKYGLHRLSRRMEMLALGGVALFLCPFDHAPDLEVLHDACKRFGIEIKYYEVSADVDKEDKHG